MCGIVGVIQGQNTVQPKMLHDMIRAIAHRGPDDEGVFVDHGVGLGHKRLSIIDARNGHQPMTNEDGSLWIVFNGAVYNYLEIRQDLVKLGHDIKTYCDTEVILHAYEEYGEQCVKRFNGMFSFLIYDKKKQQIFASRDRFGVKPFYYYCDGQKFLFASEIKGILASNIVPREVNYEGIQDYIVFQFTLGRKTMFKNIFKLEPGWSMTMDLDKTLDPRLKQYWDLEFKYDTEHTEEYFVDKLKFLLEDAVRLRLRSDVEVGSFLSGGLDSSTIACVAAECMEHSRLKTFTGKFAEGLDYDESKYAKAAASYAGAEYNELTMTAEEFRNSLQDIIYYLDEPCAGPGVFPQYMVSKLASRQVKVALGGQGGDEIFIGYARYLVAYLEECVKGAIFETANKDRFAVTLDSITPNLALLKNYVPMLRNFLKDGVFTTQEERYFRIVDRSESTAHLFKQELFTGSSYSTFDSFKKIFADKNLQSYINKMTYFDLKASLPALLHVDDRTSMAWGLETRLPLLDYRIAELFASIPPNMKFKGGQNKALFKKAVKNILPKEILNRKDKMGFPVPLVQWYKTDLKSYVEEILLGQRTEERGIYNVAAIRQHLHQETNFSRVTWGLLCLEIWFRTFIDGDVVFKH